MTHDEYLRLQLANTQMEGDHGTYAAGVHDYIGHVVHDLGPTDVILELGCGDGTGLKLLKERRLTAIGLDIADNKLARALPVGLPIVKADMHALPFPGDFFTAVISGHTFEHALDPLAVLRESLRVLRPGGRFRAVVPYPDPGGMPTVHVATEPLGLYPPDLNKLRGVFTAAGFTVDDIQLHASCRAPEAIIFARKP